MEKHYEEKDQTPTLIDGGQVDEAIVNQAPINKGVFNVGITATQIKKVVGNVGGGTQLYKHILSDFLTVGGTNRNLSFYSKSSDPITTVSALHDALADGFGLQQIPTGDAIKSYCHVSMLYEINTQTYTFVILDGASPTSQATMSGATEIIDTVAAF